MTEAMSTEDPTTKNDIATDTYQPANHRLPGETKFRTAILAVLAEGPQHGLGIKDDLEDYYQKKVNHGRLYPNLDELATRDLITVSERDKRTNEYALTDEGRARVEADLRWFANRIIDDERGEA